MVNLKGMEEAVVACLITQKTLGEYQPRRPSPWPRFYQDLWALCPINRTCSVQFENSPVYVPVLCFGLVPLFPLRIFNKKLCFCFLCQLVFVFRLSHIRRKNRGNPFPSISSPHPARELRLSKCETRLNLTPRSVLVTFISLCIGRYNFAFTRSVGDVLLY